MKGTYETNNHNIVRPTTATMMNLTFSFWSEVEGLEFQRNHYNFELVSLTFKLNSWLVEE